MDYLFAFALGAIIGSFLNVVIYRGPVAWGLVEEPDRGGLARPRSYCPHCRNQLSAIDLVPLISFIALRGQCRHCNAPIAPRYFFVELIGAMAALGLYAVFGLSWLTLGLCLFAWGLIALTVIDLQTRYLPDMITLPLIGLGLAVNFQSLIVPRIDSLIGAAAGYGAFWLISELFYLIRKKEGLGGGDAKLLAAIGAFAGWQALAPTVFLASLATLLATAVTAALRRQVTAETEIPFGPGLAAAGFTLAVLGAADVHLGDLVYRFIG